MTGADRGSLLASALWQGGALPLMELATLWRIHRGHLLRGTVVGALDGTALAVRYFVECSDAWETRRVWVEATGPAGDVREVRIEIEDGRWTVDGTVRPELAGLEDVDIQVTPSTNTIPIQRLGLREGEEREVTAAWIRLPSLTVSPLAQRYRRIGPNRYGYRSGDFHADLVMGEDGLVESYGSFWRRLNG